MIQRRQQNVERGGLSTGDRSARFLKSGAETGNAHGGIHTRGHIPGCPHNLKRVILSRYATPTRIHGHRRGWVGGVENAWDGTTHARRQRTAAAKLNRSRKAVRVRCRNRRARLAAFIFLDHGWIHAQRKSAHA